MTQVDSGIWCSMYANDLESEEVQLLLYEHGAEGLGIKHGLDIKLLQQPQYRLKLRMLPIVAKQLSTSEAKVKSVVLNYNIYEVENDEFFFSAAINRRMQKYQKTIASKRKAGQKGGQISAKKRQEEKEKQQKMLAQKLSEDDSSQAVLKRCSTYKTTTDYNT